MHIERAPGVCIAHAALRNATHQVSLSQKQVLRRKACKGDVRGAGPWPTGVHEPLQNAAREVPPYQKRVLVRKAPGGDMRGAGPWPTGVL